MTVDTGAARSYEVSVPFRAGTEGYTSYRIPAVVLTHAGTVLAFAEGRVDSSADYGHIDLVLKRSADGGRTWGALQIVARDEDGTAGNPAPVVLDGGPHDGRVLLVHIRSAASATEDRIRRGEVSAADGRRVWLTYSDDDGASWSGAREITASTKRPEWRWYATTPGHALQLRYGAHAGRIVVAANHSLPPTVPGDDGTEGRYNGGHDLLSDDDGATWRIGYVDDNPDGYVNVNETTAAQLPDGRVYFNTRTDATAPGNRADAHSGDGGATLDLPFRPQAGLVAPVVEGSVLHLGEPDALLFSGPADPAYRALMTVRTSHDGGVTWRPTHTVNGLPAAYSDLVRLDEATVGLLYETGDFSAYSTITFRRIPVERLV
ncbi:MULTISPECIES: sialidase family protein [Streptomyces]|uniref:exo-alpha-sialidase n=3 Tax=Streptomyces violaceusniger group TaxID=2839105 RepID=A0ABD5JLW3_9ACTN|nr:MULTISPECIES: sialidase family protein [Streptomyces]KUL64753.1 alpha-sialidase [Streptomyces violaceusniger]MEE4588104.1 sialidase family protein [Streptomyces sp. DSM 41602]RSS36991.1 exo-alpha-sialidase [Streptomyces sp. WAC05858]